MNLLFDQNISFRVVRQLQPIFPEARHVKDFDLQFASDASIWAFAAVNGFTIVTLDSDFYDLVTLKGHPPKIIWLRLGNTSSLNLARVFAKHKVVISQFIVDGNFSTVGCLEINQ